MGQHVHLPLCVPGTPPGEGPFPPWSQGVGSGLGPSGGHGGGLGLREPAAQPPPQVLSGSLTSALSPGVLWKW